MKEQLTLGELIDALKRKDGALPVYFDFAYFQPDGVRSYRGFYEQLALGYKVYGAGEDCSVEDLLTQLRDAVGQSFTGYKGGEFRMARDTPLWASNYGEATGTAIVDVIETDGRIVLATAYGD